jgi:electron-transferring-flavoprotein dehydrogenase
MIIRTLPLRSLELVFRQSCRQQLQHGVRYRIHGSVLKVRGFHLSVAARDREFDPRSIERESDEVDVCIVGGGPAGLSAAIRLKQLAAKEDREIRVLLLEKGSEMGTLVSP